MGLVKDLLNLGINNIKKLMEEPCEHDWEIIDSRTLDAPIVVHHNNTVGKKNARGEGPPEFRVGGQDNLLKACTMKYVCVLKCKGPCGRVKKYVVKNTRM